MRFFINSILLRLLTSDLMPSCPHCVVLWLLAQFASLQAHGQQSARLLCPWGFSRQEYQSGLPCPPRGDLPNPGMEPRPPALLVDSLLSEQQQKAKNTGVGSLFLLQVNFTTQELNWGLLHCRQILVHITHLQIY